MHKFQNVVVNSINRRPFKIAERDASGEVIWEDREAGLVKSKDGTVAIDWFYPSDSGELLAYGLSESGDEESVLHIMNVETGEQLPTRIPGTRFASVVWEIAIPSVPPRLRATLSRLDAWAVARCGRPI